jgi:large subunit ribosomal protein L21
MFAIVATSGKQYKVTEGDRILVDRVAADVGAAVRLDSVLLVGGDEHSMVGTPLVSGALVDATVVAHRSGDKIIVFKFEARKRHRRKIGHRQQLSELQIGAIHAPGRKDEPAATENPRAKAKSGTASSAGRGKKAGVTEAQPGG